MSARWQWILKQIGKRLWFRASLFSLLGVVSALAALDEVRARGHQPDRPIGLVNFIDEEGARFGVACAVRCSLSPPKKPVHS